MVNLLMNEQEVKKLVQRVKDQEERIKDFDEKEKRKNEKLIKDEAEEDGKAPSPLDQWDKWDNGNLVQWMTTKSSLMQLQLLSELATLNSKRREIVHLYGHS